MKKLMLIVSLVLVFGCNNSSENTAETGDPNKTHPVEETVPDSLKIVNDSIVVPEHDELEDSTRVGKD